MRTDSDRINPTDYSIRSYLEDLQHKRYQIPTFQRNVVWDSNSVKKLWDSIYRYYPIGSLLIWKTDLRLQNHREIGGHVIANEKEPDQYQYVLDGQQRTTSLLTSIYGGKIEGRDDFDPKLYVDLEVEDEEEIDDETFKKRFLFWDEIDDKGGTNKRNIRRMERYKGGLIVSLYQIMFDCEGVEGPLDEKGHKFQSPVRRRLRRIKHALDNYRLSFIELKGITVSEVCQIFERINQEGKPLDIFDIVVAKTFRVAQNGENGFYLRELIDNFRDELASSQFASIDDLTYLQILAVIVRRELPDANIFNITPVYLNRLRTEHIEAVWDGTKGAIRKLFGFLDNHLYLKGPKLIPYRYFYLTLANHFYKNPQPDYDFLKQYFWFYSFHNEDLLTNTTQMRDQVDLLAQAKNGKQEPLERFLIDRDRLRTAAYSTRGRLSTAILALLANQEPRDWKHTDQHVLNDVYYTLSDKPNLHHIFPVGYIDKHPGTNKLDVNSLMNIAYLTQLTNIRIRDKNPLIYLRDYDTPDLERVLQDHLVPLEILEWARQEEMPPNALDVFIEKRIDLFVAVLRQKLSGLIFDVVDTKGESQP